MRKTVSQNDSLFSTHTLIFTGLMEGYLESGISRVLAVRLNAYTERSFSLQSPTSAFTNLFLLCRTPPPPLLMRVGKILVMRTVSPDILWYCIITIRRSRPQSNFCIRSFVTFTLDQDGSEFIHQVGSPDKLTNVFCPELFRYQGKWKAVFYFGALS